MIGFNRTGKMGEEVREDTGPDIAQQNRRLEIFKAVISANVQINEEFFPFLQQSINWVESGEVPKEAIELTMHG